MENLLAQLAKDKKTETAGEQVRLAGRGVELKDDEAKAKSQIEKAFADAGLKVPLMKEVLDKLPVDKARAQKLVTLLLRDRVLIKLADDLVFPSRSARRPAPTHGRAKSQDAEDRRRDFQRSARRHPQIRYPSARIS